MRLEEESGVLKEGFAKLESYLDSSAGVAITPS
jgi:hypothetical protein